MELIIEQYPLKYNYKYKIIDSGITIYNAEINRTIVPGLRKIRLNEVEGKEICVLQQEDSKKLLIGQIPILNWFNWSACPYVYYKDRNKMGFLKEKSPGSNYVLGEVCGQMYEMWNHTAKDTSIYCNNIQVGAIKRNPLKVFDGDEYKLIYDKRLDRELAIIFCLLSDVLWETSDDGVVGVSYEYKIQLGGRKLDTNWKPEE